MVYDQRYSATEMQADYRLLAEWGAIHRVRYFWRSTPYGQCEVWSAKHPTAEAAHMDAAEAAIRAGYTVPKWWEWWRWSEKNLPLPTHR